MSAEPALLSWLAGLPAAAVYAVAALVVLAETGLIVGLLLPGEITLLCVGYVASIGVVRLPTALAVMTLAALAGDGLAYAEGRRVGPKLRDGRLGHWVGPRRWHRAQRLFARHGGRAVGLGRFVAFARTLVPRLAGMAGVPYRRVLPWDALGAAGSVGVSVAAGYLAGRSYTRVAGLFGQATGAVLLLALLVAGLVLIGRYLGRHRTPVVAFAEQLVRTRPLRRLERWYTAGFDRLTTRFGATGAVAANLAVGVPALLGIGYALTWLVDHLVRQSGLPQLNEAVARWFAGERVPALAGAADDLLGVLRGSYLVGAVAVTGLVLSWILRARRADPDEVLTTAGAVVPLLVLAVAADWARPGGHAAALLPGQVVLDTASLGTLAWLLARRLRWQAAVTVWTVAYGLAVLIGGARLYTGRDQPSHVVASALVGALWVLMFAVAGRTRARRGEPSERPGEPAARAPRT